MKPASNATLTDGPLLKPLLRLALPFMVGNVLNLVTLVVDRFWVGKVGTVAMAALGTAQSAVGVLMTIGMGMAIGTLAGVARAIGGGDPVRAGRVFGQGMLIALALGLTFLGLGFVLPEPVMAFMGTDPAMSGPAVGYLRVSMWGFAAQVPLMMLSFALQGAGEARAALRVSAVAPVVNAALDPVFIFTLGLGLPGAAWATALANLLGLGAGLWVVGRGRLALRPVPGMWRPRSVLAGQILRIGIPGSLEHTVRTIATFSLLKILNGFGPVVVSAYTTTTIVIMTLIFPGVALGQATASLVGQCLGAGRPQRATRTAWLSVGLYAVFMTLLGVGFAAVAPYVVAVFDDNPAVVAEGTAQLRILAWCFPPLAAALVLGKAFGGAGTTIPAMTSATIAHVVYQLPLAWWLGERYGPTGAYWAMSTAFMLHGLLSTGLFVRFFGARVAQDPGGVDGVKLPSPPAEVAGGRGH